MSRSFRKKSNQIFITLTVAKRVTSGGAHLRGSAPGLHSSEETSQRWRAVGDTVPIWPTRDLNPRPPALTAYALSNWANIITS